MTTEPKTPQMAQSYGIEFFHIYTDETITDIHMSSLNYLKSAQRAWDFPQELIILIDNYNPTEHILSQDDVMDFLAEQGLRPKYWAFEADMVGNARVLLENITSPKLKREYTKYVADKNKYPCSLLTAAWYLTRLGKMDASMIKSSDASEYHAPERLINILPYAYKEVENRAREVIAKSSFSESVDMIQDLFYPAGSHRKIDLF